MSGYTPSPWHITPDGRSVWGGGRRVASIGPANGHNVANANLIVASPDLLTACEELMATGLQLGWPMDTTIAKIEAAIAKAKGETP